MVEAATQAMEAATAAERQAAQKIRDERAAAIAAFKAKAHLG